MRNVRRVKSQGTPNIYQLFYKTYHLANVRYVFKENNEGIRVSIEIALTHFVEQKPEI